jgi:hypothetical protein
MLIVEQILHPEREVPLDSLPLATHHTGSYVIETEAETEKTDALLRARPSKVTPQQRLVIRRKLVSTKAAGKTRLTQRYGGKTVQNEIREPAHLNGDKQLCDATARLLEGECNGVTRVYEIATVQEIAQLGRQTGVTASVALSLAEVVTVEGLRLMTRYGNLNVAPPGCVSVATSVSAAGGRAVRPGRWEGDKNKVWDRLSRMTWAATHEITDGCPFVSLEDAKLVADCLPVDRLLAVHNESQLIDLRVRHGMDATDPIVALLWSITSLGGGRPSHAVLSHHIYIYIHIYIHR